MKRKVIPLIIVVLAVAAFWFRSHWLPAPHGENQYLGYVEGDTVLVGATQAGRLASVTPKQGDHVKQGDLLFRLDDAVLQAQLVAAETAVRTAEATYDNLLTGKRQAELAIYDAQRAEAEAGLVQARKELARASELATSGTAAQSRLDAAQAQVATFEARIAQAAANKAAAELPARPDDIVAAKSRIAEASANVTQLRRRLDDLATPAPADALVDDVYFAAGEVVAAGQPVVSLLPPGAVSLRLFIPEADVAKAGPGTPITFSCDACGGPRTATITHVAAEPEFTPPVIYSQTVRAKLVFRAEAKPDDPRGLQPGLPVSVEPPP